MKLLEHVSAPLPKLLGLMLLSLLPAQLSAGNYNGFEFKSTYEGNTLSYKVLDEYAKTVMVKDGKNATGELVIPSEAIYTSSYEPEPIAYTVVGIEREAFLSNANIESVSIPNSVTTIGNLAFYDCTGLWEIDIPNSVTTIGSQAFYRCTSLYNVKMSNSLTSISMAMFFGCTSLGYVEIPSSVTTIESSAFSGCTSLGYVEIPNSVTTIESTAFYKTNLSNIKIPGSVTSIGESAFAYCPLVEVIIPGSVTEIRSNAFFECNELKKAACPSSLDVYFNNQDCAVIRYPADGVIDEKDCIWSSDKTVLYYVPISVDGEITIPASVAEIGIDAFYMCKPIDLNFEGNTPPTINSKRVNKYYLVTIDEFFPECWIREVKVPEGSLVAYLMTPWGLIDNLSDGGDAFTDDVFNYRVINENEVALVAGNYYGMTTISIPERVAYNGKFMYVTAIANAFNKNRIESLVLPKRLTHIGCGAFRSCSNIETLTMPESLVAIGDYALCNFDVLNEVTINSDLESIGEYAFAVCYWLRTFNHKGITKVGAGAFKSCRYLDDFTINWEEIADETFMDCLLHSVTMTGDVKVIGNNAFNNCRFKELVLPPHLTTIGNSAFANNNIKSIAIGSEITEIGEKAFDGASQLQGVSITAQTPPMANNNTFSIYDCPLYVTPGCVDTYYNFPNCWYRFSGHELIPAEKVEIEGQATISLKLGETLKLATAITPANASLPYIFWRSTNPAFATVDSEGNVTRVDNGGAAPMAEGEDVANSCEIIAETLYAGVLASVTVSDEISVIEDIVVDGTDGGLQNLDDVYTPQGVCIMRGATQADIDALAPGLYIVGGKKVLVK